MGTEHDRECRNLAEQMVELMMRGMGTRTRWALACALGAAEIDGAAGTLTLTIPTSEKAMVEAEYRTDYFQPAELGSGQPVGRNR